MVDTEDLKEKVNNDMEKEIKNTKVEETNTELTKTQKFGNWILKVFEPIKQRWPKYSLIIGAFLAAVVSLGTWSTHNFSMEYAMEFFNYVKELLNYLK